MELNSNLENKIRDILNIIDNTDENELLIKFKSFDDEEKKILLLINKYNEFITNNDTKYLEYKSKYTSELNKFLIVDDDIQTEFLMESVYNELMKPIMDKIKSRNNKIAKLKRLPWPEYHTKPNR